MNMGFYISILSGIFIIQNGSPMVSAKAVLTKSVDYVPVFSPVTLNCTFETNGVTHILWSLNNTATYNISGDCKDFTVPRINEFLYSYKCTNTHFTWTIKRASKSNDGDIWHCLVPRRLGGYLTSNEVHIHTEVPIQNVTITSPAENSVDILEHSQNQFVCKTSTGLPSPVVRWYKDRGTESDDTDDVDITSSSTSGIIGDGSTAVTSTLNYTASKGDNGMEIFCTANNTAKLLASERILLNIEYPPDVTDCKLRYDSSPHVDVTDKIGVLEGSSFTVTCGATSKQKAVYSWSGSMTSDSASLDVVNISRVQSGIYIFSARNRISKTYGQSTVGAEKRIFFDVLYAAKTGQLSNRSALAGSSLNVSCPVIRGNPSATTFKWTRSDELDEWNTQDLYIENVTKADAMVYTCTVMNTMLPTGASVEHGMDKAAFHLDVLYGATVSDFYIGGQRGQKTVTVDEYSDVQFSCEVDSNPPSYIKLTSEVATLTEQYNTKRLSYNLRSVVCLDAGVYECVGGNDKGIPSTKNVTLVVRCDSTGSGSNLGASVTIAITVGVTFGLLRQLF